MLTFAQFLSEATSLGRSIKKAMSSNTAYAILDSHPETHGSTWQAGGCGVLAHALHKHLPNSKLVDVHNTDTGKTEHVAVHHEDHVYDADGATPAKTFITKYKRREGIKHNLELTPHDAKRTAKSEIPTHASLIDKAHQHLAPHVKKHLNEGLVVEYYTVWRDWGLVHPNGSTISGPNNKAHTHSHLSSIKKIKRPEHYADFGVDKKTGELTLRTYGKKSLVGAMEALSSGNVKSHNGNIFHYHADDALGHESEHSGDAADIHKRAGHLHQKLYKSSLK